MRTGNETDCEQADAAKCRWGFIQSFCEIFQYLQTLTILVVSVVYSCKLNMGVLLLSISFSWRHYKGESPLIPPDTYNFPANGCYGLDQSINFTKIIVLA